MADPSARQSAHEAEQRFWAEVEACAQVEGEERAAREASLWQHWGAERAVLFTDLSGFSRAVAEHGILHFLELVRRKRELLGAVLSQHEGRAVKSEADSMLVVFESARAALECALAMQRACQEANRARPLEQHLLLCLGLAWGELLEVGTADVWGATVNAASVLGEDKAGAHEVLVTEELRAQAGALEGARYVETELCFSVAPRVWRLDYGQD